MRRTELIVGNTYRINGHGLSYEYCMCTDAERKECLIPHDNWRSINITDALLKCVSVPRYGQPVFAVKKGRLRGYRFGLADCRGISPTSSAPSAIISRQEKAEDIRLDLIAWHQAAAKLEAQLDAMKAKITRTERQAAMLEEYETDEEALAATLSKIVKTDGDESEILEILKEFGCTDKL